MTAVRFNVNGVGFKGGAVDSVEAGLIGFYHDGKPYKPLSADVRALLPYRWRKAFDRAGPWWEISDSARRVLHMRCDLTSARGYLLTQIYAHGFVNEGEQ